ncbi:MAG TPA: DUF3857 domain-containing protein [Puia sp.]|nr:DUF3857 domain-containing protein [Puia sp.]
MSLKRKNSKRGWPVLILVLAGLHGFAQDKSPVVSGKVTAADFAVALPAGDTSADAIVISDVGIKTFEKRAFSAWQWDGYLQRTKRVLILKKRGFGAATVTIPLQVFRSQSEDITGLKAATYNLENGSVVRTELDKKSIFREKVSENWMTERFTFPAVREGSIIEYTYTQTSPFVFNDHPWLIQNIYPCLWSEFKTSIPSEFSYSVGRQSTVPFCIETTAVSSGGYDQGNGDVKTYHWAAKDVPAMKEEPFTSTVNNYLARIDVRISGFETKAVAIARDVPTNRNVTYIEDIRAGGVLFSWVQLDRQLLNNDHFGADLTSNNSWLDKDIKDVTAGAGDDLTKARKIYAYVRDNFACNTHPGYLMSNTLKSVYKARNGSEAELNLLLIAMLVREKLHAVPVVLSTRSNGFLNELMPQGSALNYVVCKFRSGTKSFYLDASDRDLGFGQLPLECYNGYDVMVDTTERFPENALSADSLTEKKKVVVYLGNADKGGLDGTVQSYPGIAEAMEIRKKLKAPEGEKKFREQIRSGLTPEETFSDLEIDSLMMPDEPIAVSFNCRLTPDTASDIFYFTPTMTDRLTENPFKSDLRTYPVEMPYARDANYILTMDVPNGYVVEEVPKSEKIMLNDGGFFEYILSHDGDQINFRTRIRLLRANYEPQEYPLLRAFFAAIVRKESEQIVFKKKK